MHQKKSTGGDRSREAKVNRLRGILANDDWTNAMSGDDLSKALVALEAKRTTGTKEVLIGLLKAKLTEELAKFA